MLWQAPALALTAQAFLMTIALASGSSSLARCLAAGLAVVVACLSMQLMAKHRFLAWQDLEGLREMEQSLPHVRVADRTWERAGRVPTSWARRRSSYRVWQWGLATFGVSAAFTFAVALLQPHWLAR